MTALLLFLAGDLQATIEAEAKVRKGDPVTVTFTLTNTGKKSLWVLQWCTPIEGMRSDLFDVEKEGAALKYSGILVKRVEQGKQDYVEILPGASLKSKIKLSEGYDVSKPGTYKITYTSRGRVDVSQDESKIPRFFSPDKTPALVSNTITVVVEP